MYQRNKAAVRIIQTISIYYFVSQLTIATVLVSRIPAVATALVTSFSTTLCGSITPASNKFSFFMVNELNHSVHERTSHIIASAFSQPFCIIFLNGALIAILTMLNQASDSLDNHSGATILEHLSSAVPAHSTIPESMADFVALIASSILYLISDCSVSDAQPILILAILPVNLPILSFSFSILNESFSDSNRDLTSSILSFTSPVAHEIIE
ncbi:MAG: hypothetical protein RBT05_02465 [Bacteroidales bacterium]|jgi:hypothetical protein|nr:hypothetical protein [Bacteroidales bacterium]